MTRPQLIFSLGSGAGLAVLGAVLASANVADWGLFWVGIGVAGVTLVNQFQPALPLSPATVKAEH